MSIGFGVTKADIDNKAGQLIVATRDDLLTCARFCNWLQDTSIWANDAALTALGYSAGEVSTLRAAFVDMKALNTLANAGSSLGSPNDFFFNAKHLTGAQV